MLQSVFLTHCSEMLEVLMKVMCSAPCGSCYALLPIL
jgi:hypothetical protein